MKKHTIFAVFLLIILSYDPLRSQTIGMRLPDTTVLSGNNIDVPIYADNSLTGKSVMSYSLQLTFDQSYLQPLSVMTTGTLSAPFGSPAVNMSVPGKITIAGAGTASLTGSGKFIFIRFMALQPGSIYVNFTGVSYNYFNEGTPAMGFDDGSVSISAPPTIIVSPDNGIITNGEQLQFNVSGGTAPLQWFVTNSSVATVTASGMLTATHHGFTKVVVRDGSGLKDTTNLVEIRAMRLSIPINLSQWQGSDIDVPVNTTTLNGLDIYSGNFTLSFNQNILTPIGIVLPGSLLASYPAPVVNLTVPGYVSVAFGGTAPLSGAGTLVYVKFHVSEQYTGSSGINFVDGLFNEDLLPTFTNGYFNTIDLPVLSISPNSGSLVAGQTQQFALSGGGIPPVFWSVSDPLVASISQTGMMTTIRGGIVSVTATDFHGGTATSGNWVIYDTQILMPDTSACTDAPVFSYPIIIRTLPAGESIYSVQAKVTYDPTCLTFQDVETIGTLTPGWTFVSNPTTGQVIFAGSGTTSFNTSGIMVKLKFLIKPAFIPGSNVLLQLPSIILNEGIPDPLTDINGYIAGVNCLPLNLAVTGTVANLQSSCYNAINNITVAGGISAFLVQFGGSATLIAGQIIDFLPGSRVIPGGYMHGYIAPNGPYCPSNPDGSAPIGMVALNPGSLQSFFKVYPNPCAGDFTLEMDPEQSAGQVNIEVFGIQGEKVMSAMMKNELKQTFSLSAEPPGIYFIRVISGINVETRKIIRE